MPSSKRRALQPVHLVAQQIGSQLGIEFLVNAVVPTQTTGRSILLIDDLYQTGATLNAVTAILLSTGGAVKVYALALTRTKRQR